MKARTALLGLFVALTIAFASTTVYEAGIRSTLTSTSTSTTTATLTSTYTESPLAAACSGPTSVGVGSYPKLHVGTNATVLLCARVYYFSNATRTLNVSQALGITGWENNPQTGFSGRSNFTIVPSQNELVVGGPNNENEGAVIAWAITAKPGASGSYQLGFSADYILNQGENAQCGAGSTGEVIAGTGQPSYLFTGFSGCITMSFSFVGTPPTNSTKYTVINIEGSDFIGNNVLINGATYFLLTGYTESVQIQTVR
jgi:hypothetical protein